LSDTGGSPAGTSGLSPDERAGFTPVPVLAILAVVTALIERTSRPAARAAAAERPALSALWRVGMRPVWRSSR